MYQKLFDSPRSQGATSKQSVTRVKFVGGDVAVVDGAWSSTGGKDEAGKPLPDRQGASVMVLVKESGKWKIATLRSVGVPAAPAAK